MKFKNIMIAVASAFAAVAVPAQAGVLGMADLAINSLFVVDQAGNAVTTGLSITGDSRTGAAGSNYNGADGTGAGASSISGFTPGASVDVSYRCAGPSCGSLAGIYGPVENNTTTHVQTPTANYALGDMFINGSALGASGANGLTRADSSVNAATNSGGSNATILNSASVLTTFTAGQTVTAQFVMDFNAFVKAYIDPAMPAFQSGIGSGAIGWNLTLTSIDDAGFNELYWRPQQLNVGYTSTKTAQNQTYENSGRVVSEFRTLQAGRSYSLAINQSSNSLASQVPEPGSIVLVGLGLFALAGVSRRRNIKK